jgi:hypothetical protein
MISVIKFVEVENRVVCATYRNLMIKAKVVLVEKTSGTQLPDPVTTIASPIPVGSLRIKLSEQVRPGTYFLMALNGYGSYLAKSADFEVP